MDQNTAKRKTKIITYTAILTAAYVVLSILLKIPVAGTITVDLGYISLMVACVCLGSIPAMLVGALGAAIESALMASRGLSLGWILMNAIIGLICGKVLSKANTKDKKKFIPKAVFAVILSCFLGVVVKTFIDCALYKIALELKIPTGLVAWGLDSFVMLAIGLPLSMALEKRLGQLSI